MEIPQQFANFSYIVDPHTFSAYQSHQSQPQFVPTMPFARDLKVARKISEQEYPNGRKRATKACLGCKSRHQKCGFVRPCPRCVEAGCECKDGPSGRRGCKKGDSKGQERVEKQYKMQSKAFPITDVQSLSVFSSIAPKQQFYQFPTQRDMEYAYQSYQMQIKNFEMFEQHPCNESVDLNKSVDLDNLGHSDGNHDEYFVTNCEETKVSESKASQP